MQESDSIILVMVCKPVIATVQVGNFKGKKVLTAEFINEVAQIFKLEVWDDMHIVINEILR